MSPAEARLLRKLLRNTDFQDNGCFVWTGARMKGGYGHISVGGQSRRVSRVAMWLFAEMDLMGPDLVLHHCDNPPCWNPDHLYLGSVADNARDAMRRGRLQGAQGSKSSQAIINEEIAYEIKMRLRAGELQKEIAQSLGLTKQLVNMIAVGKTWAHVQLPHSTEGTYCEDCGTEIFPAYKTGRRRHACMYCYQQARKAAA